ncbi:hypothetical protein [Pedobacter sp.]
MKTSDEELKEQINAVFEDYNDGLGEQGWAELRKKYPAKETKKLPIWWLSGIAASLLLVAGLYFSNAFDRDTEKVILRAATAQKERILPEEPKQPKQENTTITKLNTITAAIHSHSAKNKSVKQESTVNKAPNYIAQTTTTAAITTSSTKEINSAVSNSTIAPTTALVIAENNNSVIAASNNEAKIIANNEINNGAVVEEQPSIPKLSTEEFLKEESRLLASSTNKDTKKNGTSKTTLEVFTGTFFNYYDDNEAKLSAGIGLNANVKMTKNLILSFGAGISQNKISFENNVPAQISSAMTSSKNNALSTPSNSFAYSATATNDLSFNGSMWSIDLPMVIKLYPTNKQDFYISTGVNSSTYLSQKYTYNYSLSNFAVQNGTAQPQQQTEQSGLKGFDFANSAIIAIGINQNIGKNILIFEPYYKPALNAMGDKNLRISSAGLNLKFNFNGNGKK